MAPRKVLYIVSKVHKSLSLEWTAKRLKDKYDIRFILLNGGATSFEDSLIQQRISVTRITYRGKFDFPMAFVRVMLFMLRMKPHVVHAHLLDAQLVGLSCSWLAGVRMRVYTRHNSNFHHVYHHHGVRYDRLSNRLATQIISISQATDETLARLENVPKKKIVKIFHGFDWTEFEQIPGSRISAIRSKWNIPSSKPVIGVIARQIEWKGIQYIIPAFREFLNVYPDACLVLANATGPYQEVITAALSTIDSSKVVCIPFEEDVAALYRVFDLFVHVPVDQLSEAFGQTYVEALASEIPSVFTRSGVAAEFVEDRKNAIVVPFRNSVSIRGALIELWSNAELRQHLIVNGKRDVTSRFGIDRMVSSLEKLYDTSPIL